MPVPSEFPALRPNEYRDAWCGQVLPDRVGSSARVAGWVHRRRDHGGLIFIDLRDRTGLLQLVFDPDRAGARLAVILDEDGSILVRDMDSGEQRPVDPARLVEEIGGPPTG